MWLDDALYEVLARERMTRDQNHAARQRRALEAAAAEAPGSPLSFVGALAAVLRTLWPRAAREATG